MPIGTPITEEDMKAYLQSDSLQALDGLKRMFGDFPQYPEEVQLVLANMMFNLGNSR